MVGTSEPKVLNYDTQTKNCGKKPGLTSSAAAQSINQTMSDEKKTITQMQ
jgi:hypothetical protein